MKFLSRIPNFINEVKVEMKKVSWPEKNELIGSTIVIIVSTALLALFIGVVDLILSRVIGLFLR